MASDLRFAPRRVVTPASVVVVVVVAADACFFASSRLVSSWWGLTKEKKTIRGRCRCSGRTVAVRGVPGGVV